MNWLEIISIVSSISIIMGAMFKFMWSRIDKKFDSIDKRFDRVFDELKEIRQDIANLNIRVNRLETQDEERFRNEIKWYIHENTKS